MMDVLLIEPGYRNKYPPIGLMKISYFHKYIYHDYVRFAKGELPEGFKYKKWDRVYVTTLFTFEWETTKKALQYALSVVKHNGKVFTGGILATLRPEWIEKEFPSIINNTGLLNRKGTLGLEGEECIDTLPLDYGILDDIKDEYIYPSHDAYFTYMTRGCGMNCTFCAVKTLEPTYVPYLSITESIHRIDKEFGPKRDLLLMDNNVLRSPNFNQIIDEIKSLGFQKGATFFNPKTGKTVERHVDFNQGLDAVLLNEQKAKRLGELAIKPARIAFDHVEDEETYVKAITLCAKAGIDYMSNYLLYNGEEFTGKGKSYHADTPEDLYYRMHLTMELAENLTRELGRRISIFSFPMRYIPLDNDHRGFIGVNWNAKYLRAFQCMLIPTQGKGIQGRSFFEADFGKTQEEFLENLAMPESLLTKRGFFVERKNEPIEKRELRFKKWKENKILIDLWRELYRSCNREELLRHIANNRFSPQYLDQINDEKYKRIYIFYLTPAAMIRVFTESSNETRALVRTIITQEIPFLYERIVDHALNTTITPKIMTGLIISLGNTFIKDYVKRIPIFDNPEMKEIKLLEKINRINHFSEFDFSIVRFIPYFSESSLIDESEKREIEESLYKMDDAPIRRILLSHLEELKTIMIKNNGDEIGNEQLINIIHKQIGIIYTQLSLFD